MESMIPCIYSSVKTDRGDNKMKTLIKNGQVYMKPPF